MRSYIHSTASVTLLWLMTAPAAAIDDFSIKYRLIADYSTANSNDVSASETELRSARIAIKGKVSGSLDFVSQVDIAGEEISFRQNYLRYRHKDFTVLAGNLRVGAGIEGSTGLRFLTLPSRSSLYELNDMTRQLGIYTSQEFDTGFLAAGAYKEGLGDAGTLGYSAFLLKGGRHWKTRAGGLVFTSLSYRYRDWRDTDETLRYRARAKTRAFGREFQLEQTSGQDHLVVGSAAYQNSRFYSAMEAGYTELSGGSIRSVNWLVSYFLNGKKGFQFSSGRMHQNEYDSDALPIEFAVRLDTASIRSRIDGSRTQNSVDCCYQFLSAGWYNQIQYRWCLCQATSAGTNTACQKSDHTPAY